MKLSLNNPCFESWDEMSDTNDGKFCDVCSKKVFDLRDKTDDEVVEIFKIANTNSICTKIQAKRVDSTFSFTKSVAGIVLATSLTSVVHAQIPMEKDTVREIGEVIVMGITVARFEKDDDAGNHIKKTVYKRINGWIKNENEIEGNAEVYLLTLQNLYHVKANNQGHFSLNISEKEFKYDGLLAIKFKNEPTEIYLQKFNRDNSENQHLNFTEKDGITLNSKEINKNENFFFNGEKITFREFSDLINDDEVEYFYLPNPFAKMISNDQQKGLYVAYSKNN